MKRKEMNIEEELQKSFEEWEHLYIQGGSDPFWSDGCNLNLVRNHIIHYKNQLKEKNLLPKIYYKETPPEVDVNYMARSEEIKENACKSLKSYLASVDYAYLINNIHNLSKKQLEVSNIGNVLSYVTGLHQRILSNDYIYMRRHENPKHYLEDFHNCRIQLESIIELSQMPQSFEPRNQISGQMSLYDWENEM